MYAVTIHRLAQKKLASLPERHKRMISEAIRFLGLNPNDNSLDIKKLVGRSGYRLRVGSWRILYERNDYLKVIAIEKIGARGEIYK